MANETRGNEKGNESPSVRSLPSSDDVGRVGNNAVGGHNNNNADEAQTANDDVVVKRLVRKTDLLMIPGLALGYFTNTLDRANLGNAKTGGIQRDLHLVGNQYSLLLVLFYVPFALFNIPWVIGAKRFNPIVVIPIAIAIWGVCTMASVAAKDFGGILACRIVMGAAEAAYKPCEMFYLQMFYTRREIALRVSWIGQMGYIAGAVSGLISWSVFQWHGRYKGWQYLFLIEGGITLAVALFLYVCAPRSPDKSRWYTEPERALARQRLAEDVKEADKHLSWPDARAQLRRWQTWAFAFLALMHGVGATSSSNFLPTLVKRLTKSTPKANLYTIGPNLVASVVQLACMWLSDRIQQRATVACAAALVSLIAWILLGTLHLTRLTNVGYFLTYLTTSCTFIPSCVTPVWMAANVPTTTGKAVALGASFTAFNLAGIVSSLAFREQDAPVYRPALITVGITQGVFIIAALILRQYYVRLNKKLDSGELAFAPGMEGRSKYRFAI